MQMRILSFTTFSPLAVSVWTSAIYLAFLTPLLIVHETVPTPDLESYPSINLTEAWVDLTRLTRSYHPFNSRANDEARSFLLSRIKDILTSNDADESRVSLFDDSTSNVTVWQGQGPRTNAIGAYYEGNNIIIYIRGKDDPEGDWWRQEATARNMSNSRGVLVSAHFDSVSTSFGVTDAGMGCVTILQLVKHFTAPHKQPSKGIVALLNNNEEDYAWGAYAFSTSPLMPFCDRFLNLEGTGAGGRANIFRATDIDIMRAVQGAHHPFTNVMTSDLWSSGVIRSGTDYSVFTSVYGMRGMDMAFYRPRARYHTDQDDTRHASPAALWHMLSNSVHIMTRLSAFEEEHPLDQKMPLRQGAWFDIFGKSLAVLDSQLMLALSITLLIGSPIALLVFFFYLFSCSRFRYAKPKGLWGTRTNMMKDFFRLPCAVFVAAFIVYACEALLVTFNPFIIHRHEYAVWMMMLSGAYLSIWSVTSVATDDSHSRPRHIFILSLYVWGWISHAITTSSTNQSSATYVLLILMPSLFFCAIISMYELINSSTSSSPGFISLSNHSDETDRSRVEEQSTIVPILQSTEATPLLGVAHIPEPQPATNMVSGAQDGFLHRLLQAAQTMSLPTNLKQILKDSLWLVQVILLVPANLVVFGQIALLLVSGTAETGVEDVSLWTPYTLVALFSVILLMPISPFIYRVDRGVVFFFVILFATTAIHNLFVFPFSSESRYKLFFHQTVDLDTGTSIISYKGSERYIRDVIAQLPSAAGKDVSCISSVSDRPDLLSCSYDGADSFPHVVKPMKNGSQETEYTAWIKVRKEQGEVRNKATLYLDAIESRTCNLNFAANITSFQVRGGNGGTGSFGRAPKAGFNHILLYRRDWDRPWIVDIEWDQDALTDIGGLVSCNWDDLNSQGAVPAYDESLRYIPDWVAVTKLTAGVIRGTKTF